MTFQAPERYLYDSLFDVYEDVHQNRRLSGVAHCFGPKEGKALSVLPRIRWEPGEAEDKFLPAEMGGYVAVRPHGPDGANRNVIVEEHDRRDAGCAVLFYAATYKDLERLVGAFRGALADVLRADAVYEAKSGRARGPENESQDSWTYRMPLSVRLLCADTWAATSPLTSVGTIGSTVP